MGGDKEMAMVVRKLNLLVVDDDTSTLALVVKLLRDKLGDKFNVHGADSSFTAQRWIERNCCDVLLSDIQMPGVDGMELMRIAKRYNAWTQVIFITAHSTWDRIAEAIELGASNYVLKPIKHEELIELLEQEYRRCIRWQTAVMATLSRMATAGA
jgi:DNA-binding NtrC family response regulator